jgi:LysR family transcriptional regulator, chromosome initiation inhibitor
MILGKPNLQAFLAVAELATVSAAAKQLGLTQTGMTQRIKSLERELAVTLFTRSRSGMRLTGEGRSLLRYCQEATELEGRLLADFQIRGMKSEIDLAIAGPVSLIGGRFALQCRKLQQSWPRLNLRLVIDANANRLNLLKKGAVDLAVVFPHEVSLELDSKLLKPVEYLLVAAVEWRGRELSEILANERLLSYHAEDSMSLDYLRSFDLLKWLEKPRLYANENVTLMRLLECGAGLGILPRELAEPLLVSGRLLALNGGKTMKLRFALAWYPRARMPEYFREIVRAVR